MKKKNINKHMNKHETNKQTKNSQLNLYLQFHIGFLFHFMISNMRVMGNQLILVGHLLMFSSFHDAMLRN